MPSNVKQTVAEVIVDRLLRGRQRPVPYRLCSKKIFEQMVEFDMDGLNDSELIDTLRAAHKKHRA